MSTHTLLLLLSLPIHAAIAECTYCGCCSTRIRFWSSSKDVIGMCRQQKSGGCMTALIQRRRCAANASCRSSIWDLAFSSWGGQTGCRIFGIHTNSSTIMMPTNKQAKRKASTYVHRHCQWITKTSFGAHMLTRLFQLMSFVLSFSRRLLCVSAYSILATVIPPTAHSLLHILSHGYRHDAGYSD